MNKQKLIILGAGIKSVAHLTKENIAAIQQAAIVLSLVNEPMILNWIEKNAKKVFSLNDIYFSSDRRIESYRKIAEEVQVYLQNYNNVAFVVYGHPLLLSSINDYLLKKIDREIVEVIIQPGISSFDCLLADLEIDSNSGCYCIEANELLKKAGSLDPTNHLIIWQIGILEDPGTINNFNSSSLRKLKNKLLTSYEKEHPCIIYEASLYPHLSPKLQKTTISELENGVFNRLSTLYIYPNIAL
ncbi:SAM-dependent methyltransferase [Legionella genomosp. 1]|uniref:SAM-dependent methyltransferase n=1 Tax=Legionella genomosp. 1 TaxID=1093625 RepID=UPI0013EFA250|nr:SAM-dependent methyltransferase [Legionella genomosp. 1]